MNNSPTYYYHLKDGVVYIVLIHNKRILGYIECWHFKGNCWEVVAIAAEHGFGYKMHEAAMNFLYPDWIIPARNKAIQLELINTYLKFIKRENIETKKISPKDICFSKIDETFDYWFNRKYRLKKEMNLKYKRVNYNFIKSTGIKFFNKKYPWDKPDIQYFKPLY